MKGAVTLSFVFNLALLFTRAPPCVSTFVPPCFNNHPFASNVVPGCSPHLSLFRFPSAVRFVTHTRTHGEEAGPSEICEYIVWNVCPS